MAVPLIQQIRVGAYVMKQRLAGVDKYPLVLMLEPLFRCNLVCPGCGKIDYPDTILNKRLSVAECLEAVDECGAPIVSIPGGEPLIHREIGEIVAGIVACKKFVYLCTNAMLLEKKRRNRENLMPGPAKTSRTASYSPAQTDPGGVSGSVFFELPSAFRPIERARGRASNFRDCDASSLDFTGLRGKQMVNSCHGRALFGAADGAKGGPPQPVDGFSVRRRAGSRRRAFPPIRYSGRTVAWPFRSFSKFASARTS